MSSPDSLYYDANDHCQNVNASPTPLKPPETHTQAINPPGELEPSESDDIGDHIFQLRGYQLEMLHESLRRNIIVAMDTGSGKTFIAVSRIQAELERCPQEKLVWFLAPSVALADQQHKVLSKQLPMFQNRFLSGADGVDRWREQPIWDELLAGVRIVISTHQVLLDALIHSVVKMSRLALLVFDEAHHCVAEHPASRIMREFYPSTAGDAVPAILGLTASPVVGGRVGNLEELEQNMRSISRTPKLHRGEMLRFVFQPELVKLTYPSCPSGTSASRALNSLSQIYTDLDIELDPYVMMLRSDPNTFNSKQLVKTLSKRKTYCTDQIKSFYNKSEYMFRELGLWAADYYISACIQKFQTEAYDGPLNFDFLEDSEKYYLRKVLAAVETPDETSSFPNDPIISPKVRILIEFLVTEQSEDFTGLVFVERRSEVAVLAHLLSVYEKTRDFLTISTFVGTSTVSGRKFSIGELVDVRNQRDTLDDLRYGRRNLVITTSALEEGIDVSACNVVICFEKPANLKSFIQRRGRARKSTSKFVLMFDEDSDLTKLSTWQELEEEMRQRYMDEMRQLQEIQELEELEESDAEFPIESTGAKLTRRDSVQHLYHFCATLPADAYAVLKPIFTFTERFLDSDTKAISATVLLPTSVDVSVRQACSKREWTTQKHARRDAAFEAYIALHRAGLVSDHLLPIRGDNEASDEACIIVEKIPSLVEVSGQLDPWPEIAQNWQNVTDTHASRITIYHDEEPLSEMVVLFPRQLPEVEKFVLHWDAKELFTTVITPEFSALLQQDDLTLSAEATALLLSSIYCGRMEPGKADFVALFDPISAKDIRSWLADFSGTKVADEVLSSNVFGPEVGLIRDLTQNGTLHVLQGTHKSPHVSDDIQIQATSAGHESAEYTAWLEVTRLPKRTDFLHKLPVQNQELTIGSGIKALLASECEVNNLPFAYSRFAMLIPSILHKIEIALLAEHLCVNLLSSVHFKDTNLVITAISASAARESSNYERLEFAGDSRLKFFTSLTLMAEHSRWHEGILSNRKDHIVSNARLASAALKVGLDKYILTAAFTGRKWRPRYISDLLMDQPVKTRQMSSKTLADVVEALIGAAYIDGGSEKAICCLALLLPEVPWLPPSERIETLHSLYDFPIQYPPYFAQVEQLADYTFTLKSLLVEALTHPSHQGLNTSCSYQRLEFLGDSILDNIITAAAFDHQPPIITHNLHLIRTALVNGPFLAFLCLTHSTPITRSEVISDHHHKNYSTIQTTSTQQLWQFMRHASPTISRAQQACLARHTTLKLLITKALAHGTHYPWTLLAELDAPKFFSDIVESLLGAIYIDSHGSLAACETFLERLGAMRYLRRVLEGAVALLHPKEELGMLADVESVRYVMEKVDGVEKGKGEGGEGLSCAVWVGEREVVKVEAGRTVMGVQTRAAEEAGRILKEEKAEEKKKVGKRSRSE